MTANMLLAEKVEVAWYSYTPTKAQSDNRDLNRASSVEIRTMAGADREQSRHLGLRACLPSASSVTASTHAAASSYYGNTLSLAAPQFSVGWHIVQPFQSAKHNESLIE